MSVTGYLENQFRLFEMIIRAEPDDHVVQLPVMVLNPEQEKAARIAKLQARQLERDAIAERKAANAERERIQKREAAAKWRKSEFRKMRFGGGAGGALEDG